MSAPDAGRPFPAGAAGPPPDGGDAECERCGRAMPAETGAACGACGHAALPPPPPELRQQAADAFAAGAWLTPPPPGGEDAPA